MYDEALESKYITPKLMTTQKHLVHRIFSTFQNCLELAANHVQSSMIVKRMCIKEGIWLMNKMWNFYFKITLGQQKLPYLEDIITILKLKLKQQGKCHKIMVIQSIQRSLKTSFMTNKTLVIMFPIEPQHIEECINVRDSVNKMRAIITFFIWHLSKRIFIWGFISLIERQRDRYGKLGKGRHRGKERKLSSC